MIEERSMIQPDSILEESILDNSLIEADPLFYNSPYKHQELPYVPPTLVELDVTEQYVTIRKQETALSENSDDLV